MQIADSIEEFGFNDPIAIDENNVIIDMLSTLRQHKQKGSYKESMSYVNRSIVKPKMATQEQ